MNLGFVQVPMQYIGIYFGLISLLAIIFTLHDKRAAQKGNWRIKEQTLLVIAMLGGSIAMLITMHAIRHKTKHAKFMIGIPVIILLQVATIAYFLWRRWMI